MYAVVDCDNCYVSCERVFHPDLNGKPVVVLSNNDGCVVARSNEAKQMGIKAGTPYYQLAQLFPDAKIAVFSSNYELYGELTARVMHYIREASPAYFRYSIDEAFCILKGMENIDLKAWGENLHKTIKKCVGIPVSIGIAPTKTLAKMASHYAKHYKGYNHCCLIDTDEKREKALKLYPIDEVWGVGRRYAARLMAMGDKTAYDLSIHKADWTRATFNIVLMHTVMELNGIDCIANEEPAKKKSICTSRSFNGMITDFETLRTHVANYAARCAEKMRRQDTMAHVVGVFIQTNHFREDLGQYDNYIDKRLATPSAATIDIVETATECLKEIFRQGYSYKRAGVVVMTVDAAKGIQPDLFDYDAERFEKLRKLDAAVDHINKVNGTETVVIASQKYDGGKKFADAMKREMKSKNPTTRWSDIIVLKS